MKQGVVIGALAILAALVVVPVIFSFWVEDEAHQAAGIMNSSPAEPGVGALGQPTEKNQELDEDSVLVSVTPSKYPIVGRMSVSLDQLFERENNGDPEASYEIILRSVECHTGRRNADCDDPSLSPQNNLSRLVAAAENGFVGAQENYLYDYPMLVAASGSELDGEFLKKAVKYLQAARDSGSALAMYRIGFLATQKQYGTERAPLQELGLTWTEAMGHLIAAKTVFEQTQQNTGLIGPIEQEELLLAEWELQEANDIADQLLGSSSCCFVRSKQLWRFQEGSLPPR